MFVRTVLRLYKPSNSSITNKIFALFGKYFVILYFDFYPKTFWTDYHWSAVVTISYRTPKRNDVFLGLDIFCSRKIINSYCYSRRLNLRAISGLKHATK